MIQEKYGRKSANADFQCAKLEMCKTFATKFFAATIEPGNFVNKRVQSYICTKFGHFSSKKWAQECQKKAWFIKWSIMHIFNEAEPP